MTSAPATDTPKSPAYSIVVAARDAEMTIRRALDSVVAQHFTDWELVLIDDGSIDRTESIVKDYAIRDARFRVVRQEPSGVASARNLGVSLARAGLIVFLDADDELLPEYLDEMDRFIKAEPGYDIYHPNLIIRGKSRGDVLFSTCDQVFSVEFPDLLEECVIAVGGSTVLRTLLDKLGGFREGVHCEDYDLWLRATAAGAQARYLPKPLYVYHQAATNRRSADELAGLDDLVRCMRSLIDDRAVDATMVPQVQAAIEAKRALREQVPGDRIFQAQAERFESMVIRVFGRRIGSVVLRGIHKVSWVVRPLRKRWAQRRGSATLAQVDAGIGKLSICIIGNVRSIHVRRWAAGLSERGWDVTVFGPFSLGGQSYRSVAWTSHKGHPLLKPVTSWRQILEFRRFIDRRFSVTWLHEINAGPRLAFIPRSVPLAVTVYGLDVIQEGGEEASFWGDFYATRVLRQAVLVTAASAYLLEATVNRFPWVRNVSHVVPFGVDDQIFHPLAVPTVGSPSRFVFAKAMKDIYGLDTLIRALALLVAGGVDAEVIVAGSGDATRYRELAESQGVAHRVQFLGEVDHTDLAALLRSSTAFVMPTVVRESFGVAAIEAMASGVPVIASNIGAIPQVVRDGEYGLLFEPGNERELAEKMRTLIVDADLRRRLGKRGRQAAVEQYAWQTCVSQMDNLLRSAADKLESAEVRDS